MKNKFLLIIILNILFCVLFSNDNKNIDYINDGKYIRKNSYWKSYDINDLIGELKDPNKKKTSD